jgi:ABC-2 type transport system ATP-binding protein
MPDSPGPSTPALRIEGLRKAYKNGFEALKGISLEVQQGDFFRAPRAQRRRQVDHHRHYLFACRQDCGSGVGHGVNIDEDFAGAKKHIGIVPQEFNFNMFEKVVDIVTNQAGYYGLPRHIACERAEKYLRELGLWDKRDVSGRMLSGGMKRRLMIARALVHEPRLLILDEPTAGVDIEMRRGMWDFLKQLNARGTTIILTTHYLEEAEALCRNIAIINHGEIVENSSIKDLLRRLHREVFIIDTRMRCPDAFALDKGFNAAPLTITVLRWRSRRASDSTMCSRRWMPRASAWSACAIVPTAWRRCSST